MNHPLRRACREQTLFLVVQSVPDHSFRYLIGIRAVTARLEPALDFTNFLRVDVGKCGQLAPGFGKGSGTRWQMHVVRRFDSWGPPVGASFPWRGGWITGDTGGIPFGIVGIIDLHGIPMFSENDLNIDDFQSIASLTVIGFGAIPLKIGPQ